MIDKFITIGMSPYRTPGFQDTSRLMTNSFHCPTMYVEPPKPFNAWKRAKIAELGWHFEQEQNITICTPPLKIPRKTVLLKWMFNRQAIALTKQIEQSLGKDWRSSTVVYITNWTPYQAPLVDVLQPNYLIFDLVDDVLAFPYAINREATLAQWQSLARKASVILAVSPVLCEQAQEMFHRDALYLPNGVDERFLAGPSTSVQLPEKLQSVTMAQTRSETTSHANLRIGFAGTLNHWIDYQLICDVAQAYPDVSIFLMGKTGNFGSTDVQAKYEQLRSIPNIHNLGPIAYAELPTYLHAMDILMLPRIQKESSMASSPLKIYEYLAIGKPIVTAGVPIPDEMKALLYTSEDAGGMSAAIAGAIAELQYRQDTDPPLVEQRQHYARKHTWQRRIEHAVNAMDSR